MSSTLVLGHLSRGAESPWFGFAGRSVAGQFRAALTQLLVDSLCSLARAPACLGVLTREGSIQLPSAGDGGGRQLGDVGRDLAADEDGRKAGSAGERRSENFPASRQGPWGTLENPNARGW